MPLLTIGDRQQPGAYHNIHYVVTGNPTAENKILFIMGLITDGQAWKFQADYFESLGDYEVVVYDNRGIGRSNHPTTERCTTTRMAYDALALVDHLGWHEFHLVGVSMGGMIGMELALLVPHRLVSLSLVVTHDGGKHARAPIIGAYNLLHGLLMARTDEERIQGLARILYHSKTFDNKPKIDNLVRHHRERLARRVAPSFGGVIGHFNAVLTHHVSLTRLLKMRFSNYPILVVVGTEDMLVNVKNSYRLHSILDGELFVVEDGGHGVPAEHPDLLNPKLKQHFEFAAMQRIQSKAQNNFLSYTEQLRIVNLGCHHRPRCITTLLATAAKGYISGVFFRYIFNSYVSNVKGSRRLEQSHRFGLVVAAIRTIHQAVACVYRNYRFRKAVLGFIQAHNNDPSLKPRQQWPEAGVPELPKLTILAAIISLFSLQRNLTLLQV